MHATDAKAQKIEPDLNFLNDGQKFRRQCVNVIDVKWGRIYLFYVWKFYKNFGLSVQTHLYREFWVKISQFMVFHC